jgi:hypothetical protein
MFLQLFYPWRVFERREFLEPTVTRGEGATAQRVLAVNAYAKVLYFLATIGSEVIVTLANDVRRADYRTGWQVKHIYEPSDDPVTGGYPFQAPKVVDGAYAAPVDVPRLPRRLAELSDTVVSPEALERNRQRREQYGR